MPLRIELIGSPYGNTPKNRATVAALGLRKLHSTVIQEDNPTIRGMIRKVAHLLKV
ncbi:MAG: 50S ribosomal protein L30, partial [Nitrospirae bacterium]|nr:50S ribosomal protein L30 [Fimbriimonadaceae bacterium]